MIPRFIQRTALLFSLSLLSACGDSPEPAKPKPDSAEQSDSLPKYKHTAEFVGAQNCKECHETEYKDWLKSDHFMAMQPANEDTVLGNFDDASFTHFGHETKFFKKDGKFFVNTEDEKGNKRDFEITHTFGYEPLQQYLIPFPGGRLQALQICWDTRPKEEGGQRWYHLYPDEEIPPDDVLHWTKRFFNWNYMCADCHSTHLEKNFDVAANAYHTTWSEMNVSCEACHGPGSDHVAWAKETDELKRAGYGGHLGLEVRFSESEPGAWIIDPETLRPKRSHPHDGEPAQVDACARCHAHRRPIEEVFAHGNPFHDSHRPSVLEERLYHHDGQIKEEVYVYGSFLQSKMHHEGVRCTDCHHPHTMKTLAEGNALCYRCHVPDRYDTPAHHFHPPESKGASCVECHMPETTYMVVDPRRDHSIRIPRPDLSDKLGSPNACTNCHKDKTNKWAADAIEAWRAGRPSMRKDPHPGELFADARSGKPGSVSALAYMSKDEATNAIYRATALSILEQIPTSEALEAILSGRDDKETIVRNAAAEAAFSRNLPDDKRKEIALPLLKDSSKSVRIEAARSLAEFRSSLKGAEAEAFDAAAEELIMAQKALADQPGGHMGLGVFYTNLQQMDKAKAAYRAALRIDPGHIPSASNLATILENEGDPGTGLRLLQRASEVNPTDPAIWRLLSFHYVRQGNYEAAKEPLETGLEYAPKSVELLYLYGITLNQTKQAALAQGILEMAHSIEPENAEVLFALACVARDRGEKEAAIRYARKLAPLNPSQAQGLLRELQGGNP